MARIGIKRSYAAGAFTTAAVQTLFNDIKTALIAAGFVVVRNTATDIDVLRMGATAGTVDDDTPHWALVFQDAGAIGRIKGYAVNGPDYLAAGASTSGEQLVASNEGLSAGAQVTLWFACDGREGWWWLVALQSSSANPSGYSRLHANAGVTSRRYPSDAMPGLCARYGFWEDSGGFWPAYATDKTGTRQSALWVGTWSPFGVGWSPNGIRHPGSPFPRMAVPLFPARDDGITACILGEINEVLALTDGYALEEAAIPGWIAFPLWSEATIRQAVAFPAPGSFDSGG